MKNVYDLAEYKKRRKKLKLTRAINKYKVILSFCTIFSISISLWAFVSLKAAVIFSALILMLPLLLNKKNYLPQIEKVPVSKPH
ncbi:hypothetical protein [Bacillus sp. T3]|uniref:hypothetical protein n=1 Tax=Bacillus sp. T3 TaxID=467262 RepID=UPI002981FFB9|nr:hypothetical protein [Bacillus sp. T3]